MGFLASCFIPPANLSLRPPSCCLSLPRGLLIPPSGGFLNSLGGILFFFSGALLLNSGFLDSTALDPFLIGPKGWSAPLKGLVITSKVGLIVFRPGPLGALVGLRGSLGGLKGLSGPFSPDLSSFLTDNRLGLGGLRLFGSLNGLEGLVLAGLWSIPTSLRFPFRKLFLLLNLLCRYLASEKERNENV